MANYGAKKERKTSALAREALTRENYVDLAEAVIKELNQNHVDLTTSKLRNILSMTADLKSDAQRVREKEINSDMSGRVQYLKMRIAYEAGRERAVKDFASDAGLLNKISDIGKDKEKLLLFCDYMEALTAYHKFYNENDK